LNEIPRPVTVEDLINLNQRAVLMGGGTPGVRDIERLR
jgi:NADPH-dependent glutamate synthase beta subunit-like oxidoreductase